MNRRAARVRGQNFLFELANLRDDPQAVERLRNRYPDIFPGAERLKEHWRQLKMSPPKIEGLTIRGEPSGELDMILWNGLIKPLRDGLRSLWITPNVRTKEWLKWCLRDMVVASERSVPFGSNLLFAQGPVRFDDFPEPSKLEQALIEFSADRARYCPNADCQTPYFFAIRPAQRYCGTTCAGEARHKSQMSYWKRRGKMLRTSRAKVGDIALAAPPKTNRRRGDR